jgi:hypothetical protein
MSWSDFVVHFEDVYVCRVFKTAQEGGPWHRYTFSGEWKGATAGGCGNYPQTSRNNPQFYLAVTRPTTVFVSLAQEERGGRRGDKEGIGASIHDKDGCRVANFYAKDQVLSSGYAVASEVTIEGTLQPSQSGKPYALIVSTFAPGKELGFNVTIHTDAPLDAAWVDGDSLRLIPASAPGK